MNYDLAISNLQTKIVELQKENKKNKLREIRSVNKEIQKLRNEKIKNRCMAYKES